MKGDFLFELYKRRGNCNIIVLFNMLHKNIFGWTRKSQKSQKSHKNPKRVCKTTKTGY